MREAVIIEAVRTPIARGKAIKGWLSGLHPTQLLSLSLRGVLEKAGVDKVLNAAAMTYVAAAAASVLQLLYWISRARD